MKMENNIREDMVEMFDYERKSYLQRILGHLYIYHHKTHLHVWFSVVRVRAALIVASLGPKENSRRHTRPVVLKFFGERT